MASSLQASAASAGRLALAPCAWNSRAPLFPETSKLRSGFQQRVTHHGRRGLQLKAASASSDGRRESRWDPLLANSDAGCPVPPEQQPVNEYSDLAEALFFDWATMGPFNLSVRLAGIGLFFTLAVGFPIASASFDPQKQAVQCVLSAIGGGLFPVLLATVRLYLGWQYVGSRLSSATVEYEETGWYDGQVWVKTPELLARDRLLSSYRVKPVLRKLQRVLLGLGLSISLIVTLVAFLPPYSPQPETREYPFDLVDPGYVTIIRAEEKGRQYDPEAAEQFEGGDEEGLSAAGLTVESSFVDLYRRLHAPAIMDDASDIVLQPSGYGVQGNPGYGFELLVASVDDMFAPETEASIEDEALYGTDEAKAMARSLRGFSNVTIVGLTERIENWSEEGFTEVKGSEGLEVLGGGVRSPAKKSSRISDHLGIGPDGSLGVVKSLKKDPAE